MLKKVQVFETLCTWMTFILLAMLLFGVLATMAKGGSLSNSFDLGDISGGFNTSSYPDWSGSGTYAQLSAYVGGQHKINNCGVSMYPQYWYEYDDSGHFVSKTQHGYQVSAYISGEITGSLSLSDIGSQSQGNSFSARGLSISESSGISVYRAYDSEQSQPFYSWANASASILNFVVQSAYGHYDEWLSDGGIGKGAIVADAGPVVNSATYFDYSVTWYGDFVPGTLGKGFVAPAMTSSVPEPSTMVLLVAAVIGLLVYAWRRKRQ
ncbi:MAG: PEP-CTERM sorting domain-containing protein [Candidatus Staskawiczbacteria bacterium]|nr:PEP-CTERM sorting domain-containing protein [Candidatus Staskawiczbacteria bacterium]